LLGLNGWVRNLPDGRVEAIFEGEKNSVEKMLAWCRTGTPPARVDRMEFEEESPNGGLDVFEIRY
jgi:acylphosphatase